MHLKRRWSTIDRVTMAVSLALVSSVVAVLAASCGAPPPAADGAGSLTPGPGACATPQAGCPCSAGSVVACGKTVSGDQHFLYCYEGKRVCLPSGVYGDCGDGTVVTKSVTTGLHALGIGAPGPCGADKGPLLVCTSGKKQGELCTTNLDCGGGVKRCLGGSDNGNTCKDDGDCNDPGICNPFAGTCSGGANNGQGCDTPLDCALPGLCLPGGGGGTCGAFTGICDNGSNDGEACNADVECPGGQCQSGHGHCSGGKKNDKKCRHDKHCKGGGSCTGEDAGAPSVIDPCDPYCNESTYTPTGLDAGAPFGLVDGGLTILTGGDASAPASFQTTATGDSTCAGAVNVHTNPCNGPPASLPFTACQQDFHCDTASNTCKWNAGEGWYDPAAGGVDLTIGAGCTYSGSDVVPLCNRGSVAVPANTIVGINVTTAVEDGCTAVHPTADCSVNVGAAGLAPGKCTDVVGCSVSGNKNAVVNASGRDLAEAPGRCANNASAVKYTAAPGCSTCTSCVTKLTGTIYDPRGANPLPNVLVYVPATAPAAMPSTLACDTCASLATGNPTTLTTTNFDGTFTLPNVPAGVPFPVVILSGRWRRQVMMTAIPACGSAALPVALGRLPRNKVEGDIPKMALVSAAGDQLECLLRKIGVDDTEFTSSSGAGRIHMYSHNGMTVGGEVDGPINLWGNPANLATYDFVVAPCDNNHNSYPVVLPGPNTTAPPTPTATAAQQANMKTYLNAGGRLFTSHWMSHDFVALNWPGPTGPVQEEYGTNVDSDREAPAFPYTIDTGNPVGALFAQWAPLVGAGTAGPPPKITFNSWRHLSKTVNTASGAVRVTYGDSTAAPVSHPQNAATYGGPHVNMYTFDTPWGGPQCGRVVVSQSHVSSGGGGFPAGCADLPTVAMTPQEKGFEFLFFNATACLGAPPVPPPPPPPPVLPSGVTFTSDFTGVCATGLQPVWQLFEWQANVPPGTSIAFRAATAASIALLPPAPPPALPATVAVGTANNANAFTDPSGWTYDTTGAPAFTPRPVSDHLKNDPPAAITSLATLRIYMTFNTTGAVSPTLYSWRQLYDCVPAE